MLNNMKVVQTKAYCHQKGERPKNTTRRPLSVDLTKRLLRPAGHLPSAQHDRHH
jgi:hypothetical protein